MIQKILHILTQFILFNEIFVFLSYFGASLSNFDPYLIAFSFAICVFWRKIRIPMALEGSWDATTRPYNIFTDFNP